MANTHPANAAKIDSSCLSGLFKSSETLSAWKKAKHDTLSCLLKKLPSNFVSSVKCTPSLRKMSSSSLKR